MSNIQGNNIQDNNIQDKHDKPAEQPLNSTRSLLLLYLKGLAMGLGDSVPGISGGTIAVITNIYDKLILSIRAIDQQACALLFSARLAEVWRHINGTFLLILFLGILSGLLLSANTVLYLLANYFAPLMAFFIGLVLASCWLLKNEFSATEWQNLCALCLGILFVAAISVVSPRAAEMTYFYVFFSGIIGISAMILPGLSGAFILLLLGVYEFILGALLEFNLPYLLVFVAGCAIGLLALCRILAWLLLNYHQRSYGFITGMLLGSLLVLWPWQQVLNFYTDSSGNNHSLQTINVSPLNYAELSGEDPMLVAVLLSIVVGVLVVVLLNFLSNSKFMTVSD
jgi:putative membrane protein